MQDNLSELWRDLEHAIQVINSLTQSVRDRNFVPPQSLFDASDQAIETLSAWRDEIRKRS